MRIGIFPMIAGHRGGGVETYELNLVRRLPLLDDSHEYHLFCLSQQTADSFGKLPRNVKTHVIWPPFRAASFLTTLPLAIYNSGVDLIHATFVPPLWSPRPIVLTLHDICMHTHPECYPTAVRKRFSRIVFRRFQAMEHIVCDTDTTRQQLLTHFAPAANKTSVVPLGVDDCFRPVEGAELESVMQRYSIKRPYVLFSGNLRVGGKNLIRILEAFRELRDHAGEVFLVLTGRRSWGGGELDDAIHRLELRNSILEPGWVQPEDVPALYSGAHMLAFTTLCEGFGLPALEAMACGTPVISSNCSCMPEVSGDAALLVDPESVTEIATAMRRLFDDPQLCAELRTKGFARAAQFTWDRTAQETLSVYRQLTKKFKQT